MNFELHEVVYILGILGTLAGLARFYFTRRADRDELIIWRTEVNNRLSNVEAYAKRIESESKGTDASHRATHKELLDRMDNKFNQAIQKLDDINTRLTKVETSLQDHRSECNDRRRMSGR